MRSQEHWEELADTYRRGCRACGYGRGLLIPPGRRYGHECGKRMLDDDAGEGRDGDTEKSSASSPSDTRVADRPPAALYAELRGRLQERVIGHHEAVRRLALAGVQHRLEAAGQRLLLIGPTGVGKSTLCRALAEALKAPFVVINVSEMAETNWTGYNFSDALHTLRQRASEDEERMRRAVVVLDEVDKVGVDGFDGNARGYRRGKQESLLGVLGGGVDLHYGPERDRMQWTWRSDQALVVCAGVFSGLPDGKLSPADLVDWGLMEEFVGRLGSVLRLEPLEVEAVEEVLWRELRTVGTTYRELGYCLSVTPGALHAVAELVASADSGVDPRSGARLLRDAAERGLAQMLQDGEAAGARFEITAEAVELPDRKQPQAVVGFR